ncbi:DDE-type integrase/transposase/recombinase [Enterococcus avium]|uniref:DDE-type integrase/transposase/recombinase n=1 Tax=Enterococcus avium TaxID=33945 RepID=UPI002890B477|nr:DDE-type integrase/transposase/recombinase [Enterococcus avium]MDT2464407.1 DDE-type integrase/transposase/recombinase [Enterococcus avium]MDT2503605.1 DDE-type integrase/transposase/recombinase [Enterococcus avium]
MFKQDFSTTASNQKLGSDITYINTLENCWCYLSTIMDLHSRRIIEYHFDQNITTEIFEETLDEAILNQMVEDGLILHNDLGSQYTSNKYEAKLKKLRISHSYSCKNFPYDNAGIESLHALFKKEHVYQRSAYKNFEEVKLEIFKYVQDFYNNHRVHRVIAY